MLNVEKRYAKVYRILAFTTFNFLVLIVLLNLVLAVLFLLRDYSQGRTSAVDRRVAAYREQFADLQAYTQMSSHIADKYLNEQKAMESIGFLYEPWMQFRNPEFRGVLLNTDNRGFRRTREPQPRDGKPLKVYVFGGSTTFGYGVPDDQTIPSYMQEILEQQYPNKPILVKNFGQGYYYSSQEMLLFLSLIKDGDVPDQAIFVDGWNDTAQLALGHDEPIFTPAVRQLWEAKRVKSSPKMQQSLSWIPMVRFANGLSTRFLPRKSPDFRLQEAHATKHKLIRSDEHLTQEERKKVADYVVSRYTGNVRIIRSVCEGHAIKCLFVWQPHPAYKYDRSLHKSFPFDGAVPEYWGAVSSRLEGYTSDDFLYLGNMLENVTEKVFVDDVHYNGLFNKKIAARISERLRLD